MARKDGQFDVVELKFFSINLNAQHVNGIDLFDFALHIGKWLLLDEPFYYF